MLIKVHVCPVNFPDSLIIHRKYQYLPDPPFSPNSEVSGEIVGIGEGVKHLRSGQRVIACVGSKEKLAQAKQVGADQLINHANADLKTALKKPLINVIPAQTEIYTLLIFLDFRLFPTFARTTGNDESTINQRFLKEVTGGKAIDDLANHRAAGKLAAAI